MKVGSRIDRTEDAAARSPLALKQVIVRVVREELRVRFAAEDRFAGVWVVAVVDMSTRLEWPYGCLGEVAAALHGILPRLIHLCLQCHEFDLARVVARSIDVPLAGLELGSYLPVGIQLLDLLGVVLVAKSCTGRGNEAQIWIRLGRLANSALRTVGFLVGGDLCFVRHLQFCC